MDGMGHPLFDGDFEPDWAMDAQENEPDRLQMGDPEQLLLMGAIVEGEPRRKRKPTAKDSALALDERLNRKRKRKHQPTANRKVMPQQQGDLHWICIFIALVIFLLLFLGLGVWVFIEMQVCGWRTLVLFEGCV